MGAALDELVDRRALDEILATVSLETVAEAWHCYQRREVDDFLDPDWWAIEFWQQLAFKREGVLREGLLALINASLDEHLSCVGAGPLEGFVGKANEDRLRWLEEQCRTNPDLRRALQNVHSSNRLRPRLERAAQGPLPHPTH